MRRRTPSRAAAIALILGLSPIGALAQEPVVLLPPDTDFVGTWEGSGKFTNEWASPVCGYEGKKPSVTIDVTSEQGQTKGTLTLDMKSSSPGCPPLEKHYDLVDVKVAGSRIAFIDPSGASWDLALHAGALLGIVSWRLGPTDDPLAPGFLGPDGSTPMTRLSGEVNLLRLGPKGTPAGPRGKTTTTGTVLAIAGILTANVVGAAALVATNKATKQASGGSASTNNCSPRNCTIASAQGGSCLCNIQIAQGGSCGATPGGLGGTIGAFCQISIPPVPGDLPCASQLSCNNNACQDFNTGQCAPPP